MKKFRSWIQNSDSIIFFIIFLVAGSILIAELTIFNSLMESIAQTFREDGPFAGIFVICGCLLPPAVLTLDGSWIYRSWKSYKF